MASQATGIRSLVTIEEMGDLIQFVAKRGTGVSASAAALHWVNKTPQVKKRMGDLGFPTAYGVFILEKYLDLK